MKHKTRFEKIGEMFTNSVWDINDHTFISYNVTPGMGLSMFEADTGGDETALVLDGHKYYILNGDFRESYCDAFDEGGVKACCELFTKNEKEHGSTWTTESDPVKFFIGLLERIDKS